ncbi:unnamed protein product [Dovyalis caffra]|uniref:Protein transport protein SEC23 n=1 Tax=Dovyalis caffra TaxID=77055 RepID=A0AAV1SHC5_9ROSI|nr:unnamed protein product [Dovyalis caffra]
MPWNVLPGTKQESSNCVVPVSAIYTPIKHFPNMPVLPYFPLRCRTCRSALNPFCTVDFSAKIWICPFCFQRNHFPPHYASISADNLPAELFSQCTTIEYEDPQMISSSSPSPMIFMFVVDTCIIEEEMGFLKSSLSQAIELLPDNSLVGLITFGTLVHVHELGFGEIPKTYVFKGSKDISKDQLLEQMGFFLKKPKPLTGVIAGSKDGLSSDSISRFLLPASQCEFTLNSVLEELQKDPWQVPPDQRASRCTSTALSVAACLLGACVPGSGARILAFIGGPSTEGLGAIVSKNLSEPIRSHKDLDKDSASHYHKAVKFYEGLAKQLVHQGHVLDLFACALDQVGVAELKVAVERTGGFVVLAESFGHSVFKDSFRRVFQLGDHDLGLSSNGIFEVNCSKDIKVQGIIGPCASLEKRGPLCSDTVVGQGNTSAWKMCGLDKASTLCLIFDIAKKDSPDATIQQPSSYQFYFQFLTYYQHSSGQMRLRVTTLSRRWVAGPGGTQASSAVLLYVMHYCNGHLDHRNISVGALNHIRYLVYCLHFPQINRDLIAGFDQEAAAVVLARIVSFKMENEAEFDPIRWLDKALIHICARFGDYQKDSPSSFSISSRLSIFPQFMFHLRRSQFVQVFNNSPDETAYFRVILNRENVANSVVMIQPSLISYSFHSVPEPALLDVAAIAADRILLLDSYFTVVIFHGATIAQWRKAGYHNQPEHQAFAQLLQAPRNDADEIIKERFPVPRLVICDQHGSQARFLLAKLNPSATYNSDSPLPGGDVLFTDDVSFEVFLDHLQRLALVSPPPPVPRKNRNLSSANYAMPPIPAIVQSTSDPYLSCTSSSSKAARHLLPSNRSACSVRSSKSSYWQSWSNISKLGNFIQLGRKSIDSSSRHSDLTEESLDAHNRRQEAINIVHKNAKCSPYYKGLVDYSLIISRERHPLPIPPTSPGRESHASVITSTSLSSFVFKMQEWSSCFSFSSKSNNVKGKENNAPTAVLAASKSHIKPTKPSPAVPNYSASSLSDLPSPRTTLEKETPNVNALPVVTEEKPLRERVSESKPPAAAPSQTDDDDHDLLDCPNTHDVMNLNLGRKFMWADKYQPQALQDFICNRDQAIRMQGMMRDVDCNHFIFEGPAGVGKRTMISAMLKEAFGAERVQTREERKEFNLKGEQIGRIKVRVKVSSQHVEVNLSDLKGYEKHVIVELIKETHHNRIISNHPIHPKSNHDDCRVLEFIAAQESIELPRYLAEKIADNSKNNLRQAIRSFEASWLRRYPFTEDQEILTGWEDDIANIAKDMVEEQSPKQLYIIRGKLQNLIEHDVSPDYFFESLVGELKKHLDEPFQLQLDGLHKDYNRNDGNKLEISEKELIFLLSRHEDAGKRFHDPARKNADHLFVRIEEFIAKFMSFYKISITNSKSNIQHDAGP